MRQLFGEYVLFIFSRLDVRSAFVFRGIKRRLFAPLLALATLSTGSVISAQTVNQITYAVDNNQVRVLQNHHPLWASSVNDIGVVPSNQMLNQLTMVLARSPQQEQAFEQFLKDQQNPASSDYHHWLTPEEVGARFGPSDQDIDTLAGWLQSQGLHVNWIAPSRTLIGFGGTSADLGRVFQTELRYYKVNGEQRMSVSSDPKIPEALAPAIKAIRGLYTAESRPLSHPASVRLDSPEFSLYGTHYLVPADFAVIYDLPANLTGAGQTIGIVGRARVSAADLNNFKGLTRSTFTNPTAVIPTAFGGIDPGPALTAPPTGGADDGDQSEATLDVTRAGSVAPGSQLLLVVSASTETADGIDPPIEYLVQTTPVPAQVITISFGLCESEAGSSGVTFWDTLFKQAAAEGISVFVSSGDRGSSGCDDSPNPPAIPAANSPNHICSSSYATCVGGTEFNDTSSPSTYWNSNDDVGLLSARSYIPEGAWNDPLVGSQTYVSSTGGGVSKFIATPSWQAGTGVPASRSGRYTPDIAFSASANHDGYFLCLAADGSSSNCANQLNFAIYGGTSAAAPDMAGIAALLDQKTGGAQGNLNPQLYQLAASAPSAFNDVTVASSGVTSCSVNTPSICNNSAPGPYGLSGGHAGFLVTTGYDEVTGLGSLDVANFVNAWTSTPGESATATPAFSPEAGTYSSTQSVIITDATAGAVIYYTTNGTTPTASSTVYSGPITVSASETLKAIATASGYSTSAVATAAYTIILSAAATPTFSPAAGAYTSTQTVTISDATAGATIYYTTNGTTPTTSSTVYSGPITVYSTETLEAIATASGYSASAVATAAYTISNPANPVPVIGSMSPAYTSAGSAALTLTLNGSGFTTGSTVYWATSPLATQYVSATQLTAQVPAASIATAGTTAVTVQTSGGGTSNSLQFEVDSATSGTTPPPSFTSSTATVAAGSTATYPVTLPSSATNVTATCLNLPTGASCSYSSTTNAVTITTSSSTPKGTYQVTVVFTETMPSAVAAGILLPILLLPLWFLRRKLVTRGMWFTACLGLLLMTGAAFAVGCGGGGSGSTTPPPTNRTHQVTSSGAVSLTIQ